MIVGMALQITTADDDGVTITRSRRADDDHRHLGGASRAEAAVASTRRAACISRSSRTCNGTAIANMKSAVLKALYAASPDTLSIKFNVDAYNGIPTAPQFTQGRWVGTIGPYLSLASDVPEPMHVLAQRRAWNQSSLVTSNPSPLNPAPFQVKNNYLSIDLGNAIPTIPSTSNPQLAGAFAESAWSLS